MTLNEIPAWSDIESQPWFSELTPEEKQQSLTKWQGDMMSFAKDPKEKFAVAATSKAKARSFFGEEMPDDPIADEQGSSQYPDAACRHRTPTQKSLSQVLGPIIGEDS